MNSINELKEKLKKNILTVLFLIPFVSVLCFILTFTGLPFFIVSIFVCPIWWIKKIMNTIDICIDIRTQQALLTANTINEYTKALNQ